MKKCPFCAEEIQDEAIKCKHCGERLEAKPEPEKEDPPSTEPARTVNISNLLPGAEGQGAGQNVSPFVALGTIILLVALWFFYYGFSHYTGGSETEKIYRGTVLEQDAGSKRVIANFKDSGSTNMIIGAVLFVFALMCFSVGGAQKTGAQVAESLPETTTGKPVSPQLIWACIIVAGVGLGAFLLMAMVPMLFKTKPKIESSVKPEPSVAAPVAPPVISSEERKKMAYSDGMAFGIEYLDKMRVPLRTKDEVNLSVDTMDKNTQELARKKYGENFNEFVRGIKEGMYSRLSVRERL